MDKGPTLSLARHNHLYDGTPGDDHWFRISGKWRAGDGAGRCVMGTMSSHAGTVALREGLGWGVQVWTLASGKARRLVPLSTENCAKVLEPFRWAGIRIPVAQTAYSGCTEDGRGFLCLIPGWKAELTSGMGQRSAGDEGLGLVRIQSILEGRASRPCVLVVHGVCPFGRDRCSARTHRRP